MVHSANLEAIQIIRAKIAVLQETLEALEVQSPNINGVQHVRDNIKSPKEIDFDKYQAQIDSLVVENDFIVNAKRIGTPRLVNHVISIIESYFEIRMLMQSYKRTDNVHKRLCGLARRLSNLLVTQAPRLKAALKYLHYTDIPARYNSVYIQERRRAKRLINKNKDVVIKLDINPLDVLADIATTFNHL